MKKLLAIYFSGTGNTKYATERFCEAVKTAGVDCLCMSIESGVKLEDEITAADTVLIGYPIYGSDMPCIMKEFLSSNAAIFNGKRIITLATQLYFSGDGAALAVKHLKKYGAKAECLSTIHINMPSNISDLTIFKVKNGEQNGKKLAKANGKLDVCAGKILNGKTVKNGRRFYSWCSGFFFQRLWYRLFLERKLKTSLKIDGKLCIRCGKCVTCCPVSNIELTDNSIGTRGNCTACYRCINICPVKAVSLFSKKKPKEQYKGILKSIDS